MWSMKGSVSTPSSVTSERHPVLHETADEVHVAAQAIELGDDDRRFGFPGSLQGPGHLRPVIVPVLAALHLDERLSECMFKQVRLPKSASIYTIVGGVTLSFLKAKNALISIGYMR